MTFAAKISSWIFRHLSSKGCLFKKGLQKAGHGRP